MKKLMLYLTIVCLIFIISGCKPNISELLPNEQLAVEAIRQFNNKGGTFKGENLVVVCEAESMIAGNKVSCVYMPDYDAVYYCSDFYSENEIEKTAVVVQDKLNSVNMNDYDNLDDYFEDYDKIRDGISDTDFDIYYIYARVVCGYHIDADIYNTNITLVEFETIKAYI